MKKNINQNIQFAMYTLAISLGACSQNGVDEPADAAALPKSTQIDRTGEQLEVQLAHAVAELAIRKGIPETEVTVSQARTVKWGSSAVGCPAEGMNYTQALVPGVLLLLEADGRIYRYHGGKGIDPFYCPDEQAEEPAYGPGEEFM